MTLTGAALRARNCAGAYSGLIDRADAVTAEELAASRLQFGNEEGTDAMAIAQVSRAGGGVFMCVCLCVFVCVFF